MGDVKAFIDGKIQEKKVFVVSKSTCPFCHKAKAVFQKYLKSGELSAEDYEVIDIDNRPDGAAIQDYCNKITGARTVPRVFIKGDCIGGGSESEALDRSGKLKALLQ